MEAIGAIARQSTAVRNIEELLVELCIVIVKNLRLNGVAVLTAEPDRTLILRAHDGSLKPSIETSQTVLPTRNPARGLARNAHAPRHSRGFNGPPPVLYHQASSELLLPLVSAGSPLGILVFGFTNHVCFPRR